MFREIRDRWKESRIGPLVKMTEDIFRYFELCNSYTQFAMLSAYWTVLTNLESSHGPFNYMSDSERSLLAKGLLSEARSYALNKSQGLDERINAIGGHGMALLSFYIELHNLTSPKAHDLLRKISIWSQKINDAEHAQSLQIMLNPELQKMAKEQHTSLLK